MKVKLSLFDNFDTSSQYIVLYNRGPRLSQFCNSDHGTCENWFLPFWRRADPWLYRTLGLWSQFHSSEFLSCEFLHKTSLWSIYVTNSSQLAVCVMSRMFLIRGNSSPSLKLSSLPLGKLRLYFVIWVTHWHVIMVDHYMFNWHNIYFRTRWLHQVVSSFSFPTQ